MLPESVRVSHPAVRSLHLLYSFGVEASREDGCCVVSLQKWVLSSSVSGGSTVKTESGKTNIKVTHDTKVVKLLDGVLAHI